MEGSFYHLGVPSPSMWSVESQLPYTSVWEAHVFQVYANIFSFQKT